MQSESVAAMDQGRGCFAMCENEQFVYVFGGISGSITNFQERSPEKESRLQKGCEKYNIKEDRWYKLTDLPFNLKNATACALSVDSIFLFGGQTDIEGLSQSS